MSKIDVVVIDDDDGILWLVKEILSEKYSCKTFQSALNGLKCIEENQSPLAIIDLKLGCSLNGLDVARRIHEKCNKTYILFLTGYSQIVMENLDGNLPVIKVIEKPFDINNLINTISGFFGGDMRKSI